MSSASPSEIQFWLEWAGARLLSIHINGTKPGQYRSFWPDYPDDAKTAYGYTNERFRIPSPNSSEISLMDEILQTILLTPVVVQRRIIGLRILIFPLSGRNLYSWTRIASIIHSERRAVKHQFEIGIKTITKNIPDEKVKNIRPSFDLAHYKPLDLHAIP